MRSLAELTKFVEIAWQHFAFITPERPAHRDT
jgi:hypothetical protein